MQHNQPRASILLPVYNGARYIAGALKSIQKQSFHEWELIVLDDGSTDETAKIVREHIRTDERIRHERTSENLGLQQTLNRGLRLARGTYVARIDDDDEWVDPAKLEQQVVFLDVHPDYALVGTGAVVIDESGKELYRYRPPRTDIEIRRRILFKNCFTHSSVLFRRDVVRALGGYGEDHPARHVEDYDLWLRLLRTKQCANLPIYGVRFRMRESAISGKHKEEQMRKAIVLIKHYGRDYPHRSLAILWSYIRLWGYQLLQMPVLRSLRVALLRIYKNT